MMAPVLRVAAGPAASELVALPAGAAAQGAPGNFIEDFKGQFGGSASKIGALAEAMPAEVYDWSPAEGVASVARGYMHIARGTKPSDLNAERTLCGRQVGEWAVLLPLVTHMSEHLGQSIAYARMNGVVPPWSR